MQLPIKSKVAVILLEMSVSENIMIQICKIQIALRPEIFQWRLTVRHPVYSIYFAAFQSDQNNVGWGSWIFAIVCFFACHFQETRTSSTSFEKASCVLRSSVLRRSGRGPGWGRVELEKPHHNLFNSTAPTCPHPEL